MEVWFGVVWCSPQIIKFECNRFVRPEDGRSACEYCRRYLVRVGTCIPELPTSYEEVVCGDETDAQTNTV